MKFSFLSFLKNEAPVNAEKNAISSSYKRGKTLLTVGVPTKPKSAKTLSSYINLFAFSKVSSGSYLSSYIKNSIFLFFSK